MKCVGLLAQSISADGYCNASSSHANPFALKEAAWLVSQMLGHRPNSGGAAFADGLRLCLLGSDEFTTGIAEFAKLKAPESVPELSDKDCWDARARGTGGSQWDSYCSCGEENLLGYQSDPYDKENLPMHEFTRNIHLRGLMNIDPNFDMRLLST